MKEREKIENDEINLQADTLTDLPVTDEQANQAKAGASKASPKLFLFCADGEH